MEPCKNFFGSMRQTVFCILMMTSVVAAPLHGQNDEIEFKTLDELSKAAKHGNVDAQYILGKCYHDGTMVKKNPSKAIKWWKSAAEQGHAEAQFRMGWYHDGLSNYEKNKPLAEKWYLMAAEQGHADAQYELARYYEHRNRWGKENNYPEAVKWHTKAAGQNHAQAMYQLSLYYWHQIEAERGRVKVDFDKAKDLMRRAIEGLDPKYKDHYENVYRSLLNSELHYKADNGDVEMSYRLGKKYEEGDKRYNIEKNPTWAYIKYSDAAKKGHALAQRELALCYEYGKGATKDLYDAAQWYLKAAEQGDMFSQVKIADFYYTGTKGQYFEWKQNYVEAVKWYRKAAEQGSNSAKYRLGLCYYDGTGVTKNHAEAVKLFKEATQTKYPDTDALYALGICYYNGEGARKDYVEAMRLFQKAADRYNAKAQQKLGDCYYYGYGVIQDYHEAAVWYKKASDAGLAQATESLKRANEMISYMTQADNAQNHSKNIGNSDVSALNHQGIIYLNDNNYAEAYNCFKKAAEQGNSAAQFNLGIMYYDGKGVKKNIAEAIKWTRRSAEQGFAEAQFNLGIYHYNGLDVSPNYTEAIKWISKSAQQGYVRAQYTLGHAYVHGNGVAENYTEAVRWYRKAAEQGDASAQAELGRCYLLGRGVTKDINIAKEWLNKAAEKGSETAQQLLMIVEVDTM